MTTKHETLQDTPENKPAENKTSGLDNIAQTQTNNENPKTTETNQTQSEDVVLKKDVDTLLAKVRQEEKGKLYPEIEKLKNKTVELETMKKTLEQQIQDRQKEVEELRAGKLGELESVNKELSALRETNQKLSSAIENVATEAAARIRKSELSSYRERRLREAGLSKLHDMVKGESEEEIEASLKDAKNIESSIYESAKEEALAQLAKDLPRPIAPDGSQGRDLLSTMTPQKRDNIVKLDRSDYQKQREQLLAEAKRKAGM